MPTLSEKRQAVLDKIKATPPSEDDPHPNVHGVLLSDEIAYYVGQCHLIDPFKKQNLKPAAYELTIRDEYFLAGEFKTLSSKGGRSTRIIIPPFEVAVIKTAEFICLPRYMIARWNIRVRHAYSGLLWVGGPQVDPGYVGHLFCPLYNLSDKPVTLHKDEQIAVIDFVKTTEFNGSDTTGKVVRYNFPPSRWIIEDFNIDGLRSALFAMAGIRLIAVEDEIKNIGARFATYTQMSFAVFALVISAIAVLSRANFENIAIGAAFWGSAAISIALASFLSSLFSFLNRRVGGLFHERYGLFMGRTPKFVRQFLWRAWWLGLCICLALVSAAGWGLYKVTEPHFDEFRRQQALSKSEVDTIRTSTSSALEHLSERLQQIERNPPATIDDLNGLKKVLEQELHNVVIPSNVGSGVQTDTIHRDR
jgi:deoxycytidine triphosphate deaminase